MEIAYVLTFTHPSCDHPAAMEGEVVLLGVFSTVDNALAAAVEASIKYDGRYKTVYFDREGFWMPRLIDGKRTKFWRNKGFRAEAIKVDHHISSNRLHQHP